MKKLIIVLLVILGGVIAYKKFANPTEMVATIQSDADSYSETLKLAKNNNKEVLIVFHADWCKPCQELGNVMSGLKTKIKKKYVFYYSNIDNEKNLANKFGVSSIPRYFILDSDGKVLKSGSNYKTSSEFSKWADL